MAASTSEKLRAKVVTTVVPSKGTARSIEVTGDLKPKNDELADFRILAVMAGSVLTTLMTSTNWVSGSRASSKSRTGAVGSVGSCDEDQIFLGSITLRLPAPAHSSRSRCSK